MAITPALPTSARDLVLSFIRVLEAGGGAAEIRPYLADDFELVEAPHLLAPEGSRRSLTDVLSGADQSAEVVSDQRFEIHRTTVEGSRVVVEADWSATVKMDLRYWDRGERIRATTCSVFDLQKGRIARQASYDCYHRP
ncbi:SnoaL-like domain protein [Arthrobacter ulcerisalmonis]|uniref:SnoaL-like domain protein n=1 Tax=Arthrobacter ulcerisalmonis TaxID=2483813 RepID=A0A3P5XQC6_9MICC|nr:nuclear transport factor 2 family protein [Arthrobacter ulcerisalmonis]VDC31034.1 SnoaL-like domain protein [Arthrobacter ulcerisalmonis]